MLQNAFQAFNERINSLHLQPNLYHVKRRQLAKDWYVFLPFGVLLVEKGRSLDISDPLRANDLVSL